MSEAKKLTVNTAWNYGQTLSMNGSAATNMLMNGAKKTISLGIATITRSVK